MSDISIDGKKYKKEQMSDEQVTIVNKLANIQQSKNNLLSQVQDLEILAGVYVGKFKDAKLKDEEKKDCVKRNVEHLELMVSKDYCTNEDMTASNKAIEDGKSYLA
jgi:hypothetical protein